MAQKPEFSAWCAARRRCTNPKSRDFKDYGARGITMCSEWLDDFNAFLNHIGPRPSSKHSLDRIDNDKGYQPGNVRWATAKQQLNNRRDFHNATLMTVGGVTHTARRWSDLTGISTNCIRSRWHNGKRTADKLFAPPRVFKNRRAPTE